MIEVRFVIVFFPWPHIGQCSEYKSWNLNNSYSLCNSGGRCYRELPPMRWTRNDGLLRCCERCLPLDVQWVLRSLNFWNWHGKSMRWLPSVLFLTVTLITLTLSRNWGYLLFLVVRGWSWFISRTLSIHFCIIEIAVSSCCNPKHIEWGETIHFNLF